LPEALPAAHDTIKLHDPPEVRVVEASTTLAETDILNDDKMIDVAPDRPCGTIRVKLADSSLDSTLVWQSETAFRRVLAPSRAAK
jgi:hypothetical protein